MEDNLIAELLGRLPIPLLLLVLGVGLTYRRLRADMDLADSRERRRRELLERDWGAAYLRRLNAALDWLTGLIGDGGHREAAAPGTRAHPWGLGHNPWTARAYGLCLTLAFAYPLLGLLGFWLVGGGDGVLGAWVILPAAPLPTRLLVAGGLVLVLIALWRAGRSEGWRALGLFAVGVAVVVVVVGVVVGAVVVAGALALALAFAVAVFVAVAFAVAFAGAFAVAGVGVGAVAVASAVAVAVAVAVTSAVAVAVASVVAFAFAFAVAVVYAVPFAVFFLEDRARRQAWLGAFHLGLWLLLITAALIALDRLPRLGDDLGFEETWLLFLGLLPLINAPLDWLSLGVSRGLLGAIANGSHRGVIALAWALADLLLALAFLVLVAAATVGILALANRLAIAGGGVTLVDLDALLAGIAAHPADPRWYWVYFMLLTTLVPTLIHLAAAGIAAVLTLGQVGLLARARADWAARLAGAGEDASARSDAAWFLTAATWIGVLAPLLLLSLAWTWAATLWDWRLLDHLLQGLMALAHWIDPRSPVPAGP